VHRFRHCRCIAPFGQAPQALERRHRFAQALLVAGILEVEALAASGSREHLPGQSGLAGLARPEQRGDLPNPPGCDRVNGDVRGDNWQA